ncbi:MAG: M48 family metallopeptidase [Rhizobiaceae bacterium]|nr:M48 family metallopeptidase [Rhizobiaceae bacterium]
MAIAVQQNRSRAAARLASRCLAALVALPLAFAPMPAYAQTAVPIVRDAEIEALMRDYARPILKAAGLESANVEVVLVADKSFNAFVTGRRIFFHTGALMQAETPNEVIGVLAHETGHLAGGHQERLHEQLRRANAIAVAGMLLGIGVAAAGGATGNNALGAAGGGIAMGAPEVAIRGLLGYQRSEETTADRSAIDYLLKTGQSPRGMLKTFERFASAMSLAGVQVDPYTISHPMPRERIGALETIAKQSPYWDRKDPAELQLRHDMMRVKLAAYTQGQGAVQRMFRGEAARGPAARYGDAIVTYLYGQPKAALDKVDALLKSQPKNPYLHELRGDILIKSRRGADAAAAYARAVSLDPARTGLLRVGYGQALLASGKPDDVKKAVTELSAGLHRDKEFVTGYRYLAQAYGMTGDVGMAELTTAEGHYYSGQLREAKIFAARAQTKLRKGSPPWVRAQDIINMRSKNR